MDLKILTGGKHGREFQQYLKDNHPEINCKLSTSTEESLKLLPEVNSLAGFNFLPPSKLSHIKWIHSFGAGVESFFHHQLPDDLLLTKTTGNMARRIAEYCLTYLLMDTKDVEGYAARQQKKVWQQYYPTELKDKTVYIFGTGFIGDGIAELLKPLVKSVVGFNTSGNITENFTTCYPIHEFESINYIQDACFINAMPLTEKTEYFFHSEVFNLWNNALFINIGRGLSVKESDLMLALKEGCIRKAVLDVFQDEPLSENHQFWEHPQITITPHISGITTFKDIIKSFEIAYQHLQKGEPNPLAVNLQKGY